MKSHTPAPWHVGAGNGEGSVFSADGRMRLTDKGTALYPVCTVIDFDGEAEANARLIAAAPELLEALIDCGSVLQSIENQIKGKSVAITLVLEKFRAVITKVTGE